MTQTIDFEQGLKNINRLIISGWTGRDKKSVEAHILELEKLGIQRPKNIPSFYRISKDRISSNNVIEVSGEDTSGEVEFVIAKSSVGLIIGVGSDHTDRKLETINISQSKQVCEKVIASKFWKYADLQSHWSHLILRSYIYENEERVLYQEGLVTHMLNIETLLEKFTSSTGTQLQNSDLIMGGTLAAIGGIRGTGNFEFELEDPILSRKITHQYGVNVLHK
ncbi:MAG: DUF2848 domain-containing protein [Gammaproteobacteria bacterium]|nr:DUF2848 domain-containing protein [Gammaproteobacteria bacterium]